MAGLKIGASPDQSMNLPKVVLPDRPGTGRQLLHGGERLGMVEHVQMIPHGFAPDRDARLEDHRCFGAGQRVPRERVRRVGQLHLQPALQRAQHAGRGGPSSVKLGFFGGDPLRQLV